MIIGENIRESTAKEIAIALRAIASFHVHCWKSKKLEELERFVLTTLIREVFGTTYIHHD
jgi:hypothetical protein